MLPLHNSALGLSPPLPSPPVLALGLLVMELVLALGLLVPLLVLPELSLSALWPEVLL